MRLFEGTQFDIPPVCERCGKVDEECRCPLAAAPVVPASEQTARVAVEQRKRGKVVTVVRGLVNDSALPPLLKTLKDACGAGGTMKDEALELQGDHSDRVAELLRAVGYRVKS